MNRDNFTRRLGVVLLISMPLVSLANVWEVTELNGLSIRGIDLLFLLVWFIWVQHIFLVGKIRPGVPFFLGLVSTYFLLSLLGLAFLPNYQIQWPPLFRFAQTLLWGSLALTFIKSEGELRDLVRNIIFAGVVLSIFSIYLYLTKANLHRIAGFFSAAGGEGFGKQASFNEIGAFFALAVLLSLYYLFWERNKFPRWKITPVAIGLILNVTGLTLTQSRSAFLALIFGCFALILPEIRQLLIYSRVSKRIIIYGITILAVTIFIVVSSFYFLPVNRILFTFLRMSNEYKSAVTRLILWNQAVQVWLYDPIHFMLGYGFRTADRFIGAESAHNFFLDIGLWLGVVGLIPTTILLLWPTIKVINKVKEQRLTRVTISAFSVALVVSMFGNVLVDPFYGGCTFLLLYAVLAVLFVTPRGSVK